MLACEGSVGILFGVAVSDLSTQCVSIITKCSITHQLQIHDRNHIGLLQDVFQRASGEALAPGSLAFVVQLNGDRWGVLAQ